MTPWIDLFILTAPTVAGRRCRRAQAALAACIGRGAVARVATRRGCVSIVLSRKGAAGAFAPSAPRVTLGGKVSKLEFSSTKGLTSGYWQIDLALDSSNGKKLDVSEYYEFNSGFVANEACRNTAEAYSRAVQNLVGKAVHSPSFAELLK